MNNRTWAVAESTCMTNLTISEHSCICMGSTAAEAGKKDINIYIVSYIYIKITYVYI